MLHKKVVIAGGGVAGLTAAHALRAAGVSLPIVIAEPFVGARSPPRVLALWSNTLACLEELGLRNHVEHVGGAAYMTTAG